MKSIDTDLRLLEKDFPFRSKLEGKSVLVTGGTGLIGSLTLLFLELLKSTGTNVEIYGQARDEAKAKKVSKSVKWIIQDIKDDIDSSIKYDYIIHTASPTQSLFLATCPVETIKDIVFGSMKVFEYARKHHSTVAYLSSIEAYGELTEMSLVSEDTLGFINLSNPRCSYAEAKRLAECLAMNYSNEYGSDIRVARLTQTFGPGVAQNDNRVFCQFAKAAKNKEDIVLHSKGLSCKSYLYTTDAISALFYILVNGRSGQIYNVANPKNYISIYGLAELVVRNFNPQRHIRIEVDNKGIYPPDSSINMDISKIVSLGWSPKYELNEMFKNLILYLEQSF